MILTAIVTMAFIWDCTS